MVADATQGGGTAYAAAPILTKLPWSTFETAALNGLISVTNATDMDGAGKEGHLRFRHQFGRGTTAINAVFVDGHTEAIERGQVRIQHFSLTR